MLRYLSESKELRYISMLVYVERQRELPCYHRNWATGEKLYL